MSTDPLAFVGLAVALLAGLSWIIKAQISMSKQFTPNGGSSLRDAVNRLEKDICFKINRRKKIAANQYGRKYP